jgi:phosphoribosylamine--glycine ligase
MKVLLVGSGGREHALAHAIAKSPLLTELVAVPGNPGIAELARLVALDVSDHAAVVAFAQAEQIGLVVVGPEGPLVAGLADVLRAEGVPVFGPSAAAARLEGSKGFTKELCREAGIPTAAYARFTALAPAEAYVQAQGAPIVVKADGLAAGKGVTVAETVDDALAALRACFAAPGAEVVVEEFMQGEEASLFVLTEGEAILPLASAQDHKRVGEGDVGPNTGGMGAYSPAPALTPELEARALDEIVRPTVAAMRARGTPFQGVLYAGLMLTAEGPKLVEYNCRFGDPETQAVLPRLDGDLLPLLHACATGGLAGMTTRWREEVAITVVLAAKGYPGEPKRGGVIRGLERASAVEGVTIFHAGTARRGGELVAAGGRVLNVTALGATLAEARARAYRAVDLVDWPDGFCRRDIGWRALARAG